MLLLLLLITFPPHYPLAAFVLLCVYALINMARVHGGCQAKCERAMKAYKLTAEIGLAMNASVRTRNVGVRESRDGTARGAV